MHREKILDGFGAGTPLSFLCSSDPFFSKAFLFPLNPLKNFLLLVPGDLSPPFYVKWVPIYLKLPINPAKYPRPGGFAYYPKDCPPKSPDFFSAIIKQAPPPTHTRGLSSP